MSFRLEVFEKRPLFLRGMPVCPVMSLKEIFKKIPGLVRLVRLFRLCIYPARRSEWLLQRRNPENLFQPYGQTGFNRYPGIFSFITKRLSGTSAPRLLSFGCSTGEEVFTLRRYFPHAEIVGIDINPRSIAICNKKRASLFDEQLRFELAESTRDQPTACYDAVFCMAVLRHGNLGASRVENCSDWIRFEDFEKMVTDFCRVLKPGAYLILRHSNFRFADTRIAAEFDVVLSDKIHEARKDTPLYGRDDRLLADAVDCDIVFRKREKA